MVTYVILFTLTISVIVAQLLLLYNALVFNLKGTTIAGQNVKKTHPAYKKLKKITSPAVVSALVVALIATILLAYAEWWYVVERLGVDDARAVFMGIIVLAMFSTFWVPYKMFYEGRRSITKPPKNDWL